jgi:hypothetical protein
MPGRREASLRSPEPRGRDTRRFAGCLTRTVWDLSAGPGDPVGLRDAIGLDGPESFPEVLASLPQQLERVAGTARRSRALRISSVFLNEVSLECCGDFVRRLQRVVDGPVPCSVVNHVASIAQWVLRPHDPVKLDHLAL